MAYKDEYEVARLYTDGVFAQELAEQFEGDDLRLEFYMAPPALVKPKGGRAAAPKKVRFGPWLMPLLKVLARGRSLRGTALDPFGRTEERRLERRLIAEYEARVDELPRPCWRQRRRRDGDRQSARIDPRLRPRQAGEPGDCQGARERALNRFDPERYPRPSGPAVAGQFRGIPVTSA